MSYIAYTIIAFIFLGFSIKRYVNLHQVLRLGELLGLIVASTVWPIVMLVIVAFDKGHIEIYRKG